MSHASGDPRIHIVRGAALAPWLDAVAQLRIAVFRDYPYLYDGDAGYEARYLQTYLDTPDSVCILVLEGDAVVGASTGLPLADEGDAFQQPFIARGIAPERVFYCAESVLLPAWRGRGIGHRFFEEREAHARALGRFAWTAFAAVERADDDPRRPPDARDNAAFWRGRGYVRQPHLRMELAWKELGDDAESTHPLTYWLRPLEPTA